jgi:hypothetical protein
MTKETKVSEEGKMERKLEGRSGRGLKKLYHMPDLM